MLVARVYNVGDILLLVVEVIFLKEQMKMTTVPKRYILLCLPCPQLKHG